MAGHAFHCLAEITLSLLEKIHALADEFRKTHMGAGIVETNEALEIVVGEQGVGL